MLTVSVSTIKGNSVENQSFFLAGTNEHDFVVSLYCCPWHLLGLFIFLIKRSPVHTENPVKQQIHATNTNTITKENFISMLDFTWMNVKLSRTKWLSWFFFVLFCKCFKCLDPQGIRNSKLFFFSMTKSEKSKFSASVPRLCRTCINDNRNNQQHLLWIIYCCGERLGSIGGIFFRSHGFLSRNNREEKEGDLSSRKWKELKREEKALEMFIHFP